MIRSFPSWQVALFALLFAAACNSGTTSETGEADGERANLRFIVVTHGQASDPNWSVVKNGVDQAAEDMGVQVEYQAPESFDMVTMGQLIDAAVASNPDGLVVSIPDPAALREPIQNAIEAGIPVVSINSGSEAGKELGVLTHVGQTEYEAGFAGGERMAEAGVEKALCVNMEVGNAALDRSCQGFADAMQQGGAASEVLAVDLADPTETQQRIQAALASDPAVDGLLTLGPTAAVPALAALQETDKLEQVALATFDTSPEVLEAIRDGEMLFAIDQQMFLQGYLPVVFLTLHETNLNTFANDVIRTGPSFITQDNADRLTELAGQGTR